MGFNATRFAVTLVATMPDAVICADAQGIVRFWNSGAERVFGFSRAEAVEFTAVPLRDNTERMVGVAAVVRDVTERFEEMKALRKAAARAVPS